MPIHDGTRVRANRFHDFHQSWTIALRSALNAGRLPPLLLALGRLPAAHRFATLGILAITLIPALRLVQPTAPLA